MEMLVVNPNLPKRAGEATLYFRDDIGEPFREKKEIHLPVLPFHKQNDEEGVFLLKSGQQFLWRKGAYNSVVYFGGTDEEPFLVRLDPGVWNFFRSGGEKMFFQALKPSGIQALEKTSGQKSKRQGDIFAAKMQLSWRAALTFSFLRALERKEDPPLKPKEFSRASVFETRHLFTGVCLLASLPLLGGVLFAEGLLEAPDHADRELKGVHVLQQTAYLFDPKKAD